jgi:hypothetical protein
MHREVAQVKEGRAKKDLSAETYLTYSPWRLQFLPKLDSFPEHESKRRYPGACGGVVDSCRKTYV